MMWRAVSFIELLFRTQNTKHITQNTKHKTLLYTVQLCSLFFPQIRDTKLRNAISDTTLGGFRQTIGSLLLIWYWTRSIFVLDQNILCHNYEEPNIAGSNLAT